ncbi:4-alpha-glucanotransferase [Proteiniclasticum sp.]|uniref:4-alpha-glucanotransferase n=1 Tax=Proteiniclasticum sp. TaxID=2053595 RepID=UPI002897DF41|nr:4-alpha-glucanotransferase [Proteiniclasticum sp.]
MKKRSSGILMHISSLPGPYGIGDFGRGAYDFVDFLDRAKQKEWQILPLGITGYGDSPYQNFSAFAGNPYFIDLNEFLEQGYLEKEELVILPLGDDPLKVDYGILYKNKMELLRRAHKRAMRTIGPELRTFYEKEKNWLRDYALFMALKAEHKGISWLKWPDEYKDINSDKVREFEKNHEKEMFFHVFIQYYFFKQWRKLKNYANDKNIRIIGDIPIYVAEDSSDIWGNREIFKVDRNFVPITVAGCPPDAFSLTGQLWGNPIYNWEAMEKDGYKWWIKRIRASFEIYDVVRIDHFRGFEAFWEIKNGSENAVIGKWTKGPNMKLFDKVKEELGELDIIAEDLGFLTEEVHELIENTGYPGMKVLQFAFDPREESDYLPHTYHRNCVVYTGTHDNETIMGWVKNVNAEDLIFAGKYLKLSFEEGLNWGFIRGAFSSVADLCIIPMQDFLGLGEEARMNTPSTLGNNWIWRMREDALTDVLAAKIAKLTKMYGR